MEAEWWTTTHVASFLGLRVVGPMGIKPTTRGIKIGRSRRYPSACDRPCDLGRCVFGTCQATPSVPVLAGGFGWVKGGWTAYPLRSSSTASMQTDARDFMADHKRLVLRVCEA
jgi:hypothetical protein